MPRGEPTMAMMATIEHRTWGKRNPNHQLIDGKHPMIYRVSATIQGDAGFRNHPRSGRVFFNHEMGVKAVEMFNE